MTYFTMSSGQFYMRSNYLISPKKNRSLLSFRLYFLVIKGFCNTWDVRRTREKLINLFIKSFTDISIRLLDTLTNRKCGLLLSKNSFGSISQIDDSFLSNQSGHSLS